MGSSNAGVKSGKGFPFTPPLRKVWEKTLSTPFPLTSEVVAIEPKDPLGQVVIASNFCTVTN